MTINPRAYYRARRLLLTCLDRKQRRRFRLTRTFVITGADGHRYKLMPRMVMGVKRLDTKMYYCAHTRSIWMPVYDNMLATMLRLQADPGDFHRIAHSGDRVDLLILVWAPRVLLASGITVITFLLTSIF